MAATAITGRLSLTTPHLPHLVQTIPALIYGTAWKKEATADLVYQALKAGFTGIDTANQPKHYQEHLVGSGMRRAFREGTVKRKDIYVQTKFTSIGGQDQNNVPYDAKDPLSRQVQASVNSSLHHLRPADEQSEDVEGSYIDTLMLHSPMATISETMEVWHTLEDFVPKQIRNLGVSNCSLVTLMDIYEQANVKPIVVQNRFYPSSKYDIDVRKFCRENGMVYQSFWTLTANPELVWSAVVGRLAHRLSISPQAALYCFVLGLGNTVVLSGTKRAERMKANLEAVAQVKTLVDEHPHEWENMLEAFKKLIGETGS